MLYLSRFQGTRECIPAMSLSRILDVRVNVTSRCGVHHANCDFETLWRISLYILAIRGCLSTPVVFLSLSDSTPMSIHRVAAPRKRTYPLDMPSATDMNGCPPPTKRTKNSSLLTPPRVQIRHCGAAPDVPRSAVSSPDNEFELQLETLRSSSSPDYKETVRSIRAVLAIIGPICTSLWEYWLRSKAFTLAWSLFGTLLCVRLLSHRHFITYLERSLTMGLISPDISTGAQYRSRSEFWPTLRLR